MSNTTVIWKKAWQLDHHALLKTFERCYQIYRKDYFKLCFDKKVCENYANKKTPLARVGLNH